VIPWPSLLSVTHLVGLALGVGAATVKLVLLIKCTTDHTFVATFNKVARLITRQIILGLILLTLSGIGLVLRGYPFTPLLTFKVALVAVIWVLGPIIDHVAEPKFRQLAPEPGERPSPEFAVAQKRYLLLEVIATLLFYIVIVAWVWS